jgi:acylpyruvate hydrolase
MKFCTYLREGEPRLAVIDEGAAIDLGDGNCDLRRALRAGTNLAQATHAAVSGRATRMPLSSLSYAPVLPEPGKVICLGLNYHDHVWEAGREKPEYPWFFLRSASSLLGHGQAGIVPRVSAKFDFEGELAVVIGTRVPRHVSERDALQHVFGYTCFNDMSVRDFQKRTPQWTIGKNFDASGGFGPVLVTADQLPPGGVDLHIQSRLNDRVMQDASTGDMLFSVAQTITILAECLTLEPGDVISMGTPGGVGQSHTPALWMKPGDTIEVEIEGIGTLSNPIAAEPS